MVLARNFCGVMLQPDLNGALFAQRSGAKKREWKAEIAAQKKRLIKMRRSLYIEFGKGLFTFHFLFQFCQYV